MNTQYKAQFIDLIDCLLENKPFNTLESDNKWDLYYNKNAAIDYIISKLDTDRISQISILHDLICDTLANFPHYHLDVDETVYQDDLLQHVLKYKPLTPNERKTLENLKEEL